jgi:hypothetical protein
MKTFVKPLVLGSGLALMLCADFAPDTRLKLEFFRPAEAIIGLPFTPLSFAGVARRTAYRTVAYSSAIAASSAAAAASASAAAAAAYYHPPPPPYPPTYPTTYYAPPPGPVPIGTVVSVLPPGCVSQVIGGTSYMVCGNTFYRAAFQGSNLVYVAAQP